MLCLDFSIALVAHAHQLGVLHTWEPCKVSTRDRSKHVGGPARHHLADDYVQHCQQSLHKYGVCVRKLLGSSGHFHKWVRFQKSQVQEIISGGMWGMLELSSQITTR